MSSLLAQIVLLIVALLGMMSQIEGSNIFDKGEDFFNTLIGADK